MHGKKHNESAFVLVAVIVFATLGGILTAAMIYGTGSQISRTILSIRHEKAFYIADGGIERAKAELRTTSRTLNSILLGSDNLSGTYDDGLPAFGSPLNFGGGTFQVKITDNADSDASLFSDADETVIIRSTGTYENVSRGIEACVQISQNNLPPAAADGAVGVYGTNSTIDMLGTALIDGRDYSLPADFNCTGSGCEGAVTTNPAVPGVFSTTSIAISGTNQISGGIVTNGTSQFATNYWVEQAAALLPQASITLPGGTYNHDLELGTRSNPQITAVTGNAKFNASVDGAGILIVLGNVDIDLGGNFHYEGIIMLLGNLNCTQLGNARIFGSVISIGDDVDIDVKGTAKIMYSSAALANLQNLPLSANPLSVVYWREIK